MKRWVFRILICLVLGVVTTVGVAWGLAWMSQGKPTSMIEPEQWRPFAEPIFEDIESRAPDAVVINSRTLGGWKNVAMDRIIVGSYTLHSPLDGPVLWAGELEMTRTGWPARAMFATHRAILDQRNGKSNEETIENGTLIATGNIWLGWKPILPGFVINIFVYSIVWMMLITIGGVLRTGLRHKRRRCVKCGYDLRGSLETGCPECGWNRPEVDAS